MVKSKIKQVGLILLTLIFACTLFFGIRLLVNDKNALAEDGQSTVTLTTSKDGVSYGGDFELTITVTTIRNNVYLRNDNLYFAVYLNGTRNNAIAKYLTATFISCDIPTEPGTGYNNVYQDKLKTDGTLYCGFSKKTGGFSHDVTGTTSVTWKFKIAVDEAIKDDTAFGTDGWTSGTAFTFDLLKTKDSFCTYRPTATPNDTNSDVSDYANYPTDGNGLLNCVAASVKIQEASNDASIESLKVGYGDVGTATVDEVVTVPTSAPFNMTYACNNKDIDKFVMEITTPANAGNSTVKASLTNSEASATALNADGRVTFALDGTKDDGINKVYIFVTAEDGSTKRTYTLDVQMWYARLNSLRITTDFRTNPITETPAQTYLALPEVSAENLETTFTYKVKVPNGPHAADCAKYIYIFSTTKAGYNTSEMVTISVSDGSGLTGGTYTSPTAPATPTGKLIDVQSIVLPCTITLEVEPAYYDLAADNTVKYTLNLEAVNTCTELGGDHNPDPSDPDSYDPGIKVIGVNKDDSSKNAEVEGKVAVDENGLMVEPLQITYTLPSDAQDGFKLAVTDDLPEDYKVATGEDDEDWDVKITVSYEKITDPDDPFALPETVTEILDPDKVYDPGEYTITVESAAGTTKTFTVTVETVKSLKLSLTSNYKFLAELEVEEEVDDDEYETYYYRRAYEQMRKADGTLGWEHGKDDVDADGVKTVEEFVLGQIPYETTLNTFISNFDPDQLSMIKLYNHRNKLLYNCGAWDSSIDRDADIDEIDDPEAFTIGTGWYIEFGDNGSGQPLETIYISVLGDITNSSGTMDTGDVSDINDYLSGNLVFDKIYVRLAAYIVNRGKLSTSDPSTMNDILSGNDVISNYYYNA